MSEAPAAPPELAHAADDGGPVSLPAADKAPAAPAAPRRGPGRPRGSKTRHRARQGPAKATAPAPAPAAPATPAAPEKPEAAAVKLTLAQLIGDDAKEFAGRLATYHALAELNADKVPAVLRPGVANLGWRDPKTGGPTGRTEFAAQAMYPQLAEWSRVELEIPPAVGFLLGLGVLLGPAAWACAPGVRDLVLNRPTSSTPTNADKEAAPADEPKPAASETLGVYRGADGTTQPERRETPPA